MDIPESYNYSVLTTANIRGHVSGSDDMGSPSSQELMSFDPDDDAMFYQSTPCYLSTDLKEAMSYEVGPDNTPTWSSSDAYEDYESNIVSTDEVFCTVNTRHGFEEEPRNKSVDVNFHNGILDSNGEIKGFGSETTGKQIHQYVAVPIQSPSKMPQILPRQSITSQIMNSSVRPQIIQVDATSPFSARKRASDFLDGDFGEGKRSKKGDKGGKGLRHFSMKVCEKVQTKGVTSYNEVADELVGEFSEPHNLLSADAVTPYDQKNIRRRVYDALNVLMAMNIISKEKKEIRWIGLPTNSAQECQHLEMEKQKRIERIKHKTQQLQELILQQIAFKNLVQRNRDLERTQGPPAPNSAIQLPFIIVNTSKKTVIDCSISNDKYEYLFKFDNTFEIHDDIEVLKRMGMAFGLERGQCTQQDITRASKMVPKSLEPYVLDMANNSTPFQSTAVRPIDPSSVTAQQARYQQSTSSSAYYGIPDSSDREVMSALSRQSSSGSYDQNSRAATDTPSVYSDDDDSGSDRSSPVDLG